MSTWSPADLLHEFHERPGVDIEPPVAPTLNVPNLDARVRYLREEVEEMADAIAAGDIVALADALADITYVVYGTAWRTGIPLDAVLVAVHRSNMTKTPSPGDGKAIKGPDYSPPEVAAVLADGQLCVCGAWLDSPECSSRAHLRDSQPVSVLGM